MLGMFRSISTFHLFRKLVGVFTRHTVLVSHQKHDAYNSTNGLWQIRLFHFCGGCVHPKVDLPRKLTTKIGVVLSKSEVRGLKFFRGAPPDPFKVLPGFARHPVCPWPPYVKNCISVLVSKYLLLSLFKTNRPLESNFSFKRAPWHPFTVTDLCPPFTRKVMLSPDPLLNVEKSLDRAMFILQKCLDRATFPYILIRKVRLSVIRTYITVVHIRKV